MTTTEIILLVLLLVLIAAIIAVGTVLLVKKNKEKKQQQEEPKAVVGDDPLTAVKTTMSNMMNQMNKVSDDFAGLKANVETIKSASSNLTSIYDSSKRLNELLLGTKARGTVGEMIIGTYLKETFGSNGMLKEQHNVAKPNSPALIIDFMIETNNQKILIDAKFPSDNYLKMIESENDKEKFAEAKAQFQNDLKTKIRDLQKYIDHADHRDYVIMCLPSDSMYITALEQFKETFMHESIAKHNVLIVSPAILVPMIRLISEQSKLETEHKLYDQKIEELRTLWHAMENWRKSWKSVLDALSTFNNKVVDFNKKESTLLTKYKKIENNKTNIGEIENYKKGLKDINLSLDDNASYLDHVVEENDEE